MLIYTAAGQGAWNRGQDQAVTKRSTREDARIETGDNTFQERCLQAIIEVTGIEECHAQTDEERGSNVRTSEMKMSASIVSSDHVSRRALYRLVGGKREREVGARLDDGHRARRSVAYLRNSLLTFRMVSTFENNIANSSGFRILLSRSGLRNPWPIT